MERNLPNPEEFEEREVTDFYQGVRIDDLAQAPLDPNSQTPYRDLLDAYLAQDIGDFMPSDDLPTEITENYNFDEMYEIARDPDVTEDKASRILDTFVSFFEQEDEFRRNQD